MRFFCKQLLCQILTKALDALPLCWAYVKIRLSRVYLSSFQQNKTTAKSALAPAFLTTTPVLATLLACLLALPLTVLAQNPPQNAPRLSTSALSDPLAPPKPEPLRVAHDNAFWPFSFKEKGAYTGFDLELWQDLAASMGVEYVLMPMPFKEILPAVESGKVDVAIAAIPVTAQRGNQVLFSLPYFRSGLQVLSHKDFEPKSLEELNGKSVAVKINSEADEYATQNLKPTKLSRCKYNEEMFFKLLAGDVDAILADYSLLGAYLNITRNPDLIISAPLTKPYYLAIAMPKESPLQPQLNKALQSYRSGGRYKELALKWFGEHRPSLTPPKN